MSATRTGVTEVTKRKPPCDPTEDHNHPADCADSEDAYREHVDLENEANRMRADLEKLEEQYDMALGTIDTMTGRAKRSEAEVERLRAIVDEVANERATVSEVYGESSMAMHLECAYCGSDSYDDSEIKHDEDCIVTKARALMSPAKCDESVTP